MIINDLQKEINMAKEILRSNEEQLNLENLSTISFSEFTMRVSLLSGQKRGPLWAKFLISKGYFEREVSSNENRGDLVKNNKYFELKTALLKHKQIEDGLLFRGQQIRLYQPLFGHLFITTDEDTFETRIYYISHSKLKELYQERKVRFSSSHMVGGSKNKIATIDFELKHEWGIQLHSKDYDWTNYEITEEQIQHVSERHT